jgi:hypothetical protein
MGFGRIPDLDIHYDSGENIDLIENDILYENCQINENSFVKKEGSI